MLTTIILAAAAMTAPVNVIITETISSKAAQIGDTFTASVEGCETCVAHGEVVFIKPRAKGAKDGEMTIRIVDIDGVAVEGNLHVKGKNIAADIGALGAYGLMGGLFKGS